MPNEEYVDKEMAGKRIKGSQQLTRIFFTILFLERIWLRKFAFFLTVLIFGNMIYANALHIDLKYGKHFCILYLKSYF